MMVKKNPDIRFVNVNMGDFFFFSSCRLEVTEVVGRRGGGKEEGEGETKKVRNKKKKRKRKVKPGHKKKKNRKKQRKKG